jgi:Zn-dependent peptidase ImmA (M78 family)
MYEAELRQEAEASYFARCLLMPEKMILKEVESIPDFSLLNDLHVYLLAKRFQVNDALMAYRLGEIDICGLTQEQTND